MEAKACVYTFVILRCLSRSLRKRCDSAVWSHRSMDGIDTSMAAVHSALLERRVLLLVSVSTALALSVKGHQVSVSVSVLLPPQIGLH